MKRHQEEQEEEEASEKPNMLKPNSKILGFLSLSFCLYIRIRLNELKVKLIEDQTESIEEKDIDKLKELANEDLVIFEEEQPETFVPQITWINKLPRWFPIWAACHLIVLNYFVILKLKLKKTTVKQFHKQKMVILIILLLLFIAGTVYFVIKMKFV